MHQSLISYSFSFVDIRNRLGVEQINEINESVLRLNGLLPGIVIASPETSECDEELMEKFESDVTNQSAVDELPLKEEVIAHEGVLIVDATPFLQGIKYSTDSNLLNNARKIKRTIDFLGNLKKDIRNQGELKEFKIELVSDFPF